MPLNYESAFYDGGQERDAETSRSDSSLGLTKVSKGPLYWAKAGALALLAITGVAELATPNSEGKKSNTTENLQEFTIIPRATMNVRNAVDEFRKVKSGIQDTNEKEGYQIAISDRVDDLVITVNEALAPRPIQAEDPMRIGILAQCQEAIRVLEDSISELSDEDAGLLRKYLGGLSPRMAKLEAEVGRMSPVSKERYYVFLRNTIAYPAPSHSRTNGPSPSGEVADKTVADFMHRTGLSQSEDGQPDDLILHRDSLADQSKSFANK